MATCNFNANNVSRVFAFGMNKYISQEDIDANDWPDEYLNRYDEDLTRWDYEFEVENVIQDLQAQGWNDVSTGKYYDGDEIAEKAVSERLRLEAETVFSRNCEHELFVAWRAFNGETGYREANKRICDGSAA